MTCRPPPWRSGWGWLNPAPPSCPSPAPQGKGRGCEVGGMLIGLPPLRSGGGLGWGLLGISSPCVRSTTSTHDPAFRHASSCDEYVGPTIAARSTCSTYGINRNAASDPPTATTQSCSATPNARAATSSNARNSCGSGNRARADELARGAGYGFGLIPVERSIHGCGACGCNARATQRRPPCPARRSSMATVDAAFTTPPQKLCLKPTYAPRPIEP